MTAAAFDRKIFATGSGHRRDHNGETVWVIKRSSPGTDPARFLVRFDDGTIADVAGHDLRPAVATGDPVERATA